jgi:EpsI family protein
MTTRRALILSAAACAGAVVTAEALKPRRLLVDRVGEARLADWIPTVCGAWRQDDSMLTGSVVTGGLVDTLYQQVISRFYRHEDGRVVMLSVAYGRVQSDSLQLHTPDVCYPAQGFTLADPQDGRVVMGRTSLAVRRVVARLSGRIEPMTWWAMVGDKVAMGGTARKAAQLQYALGGELPDGMIIRISSLGSDAAREWSQQESFVRQLADALPDAVRLRMFGAAP